MPSTQPAVEDASKREETALPNLTDLRAGWSGKSASNSTAAIPPMEVASRPEKPNKKATTTLAEMPIMPNLGAIASVTAMQMDDSSPLFEEPTDGALADLPPLPNAPTKTSSISSRVMPLSVSAMPSEHVPEISLPLVRDLIAKNPDLLPDENITRTDAPTSGAAKFSPPEEATEEETGTTQFDPRKPFAEVEEGSIPTRKNFTDDDLRDALQPLIQADIDRHLYTPTHGIHTYLEPMLRSTVRRAIAEQMDDATPFREVTGWDKFSWKLRAIFSSRTYDDIVFSSTKRYQVEEVFMLRQHSRSLISYASHDPSRHVKPSRVQSTVKKIAALIGHNGNKEKTTLPWPEQRQLVVRHGEHSTLVAIVHGECNAILKSDLSFALRQAEERFGSTLAEESDIHLQVLQPLLEGCLLIQAPSIPN